MSLVLSAATKAWKFFSQREAASQTNQGSAGASTVSEVQALAEAASLESYTRTGLETRNEALRSQHDDRFRAAFEQVTASTGPVDGTARVLESDVDYLLREVIHPFKAFHLDDYGTAVPSYHDVIDCPPPIVTLCDDSSERVTTLESSHEANLLAKGWSGQSHSFFLDGPVDLSMSASATTSQASQSSEHNRTTHLLAEKLYCRRVVILDVKAMKLKPEFIDSVRTAISRPSEWEAVVSVLLLFGQIGHVVRTHMKLGGKWVLRQDIETSSTYSAEEAKASFHLAFRHFLSSTSASSDQQRFESAAAHHGSNRYLQAVGGETLSANNIDAWIGTVGNPRNWRVVETVRTINICELLPDSLRAEVSRLQAIGASLFRALPPFGIANQSALQCEKLRSGVRARLQSTSYQNVDLSDLAKLAVSLNTALAAVERRHSVFRRLSEVATDLPAPSGWQSARHIKEWRYGLVRGDEGLIGSGLARCEWPTILPDIQYESIPVWYGAEPGGSMPAVSWTCPTGKLVYGFRMVNERSDDGLNGSWAWDEGRLLERTSRFEWNFTRYWSREAKWTVEVTLLPVDKYDFSP